MRRLQVVAALGFLAVSSATYVWREWNDEASEISEDSVNGEADVAGELREAPDREAERLVVDMVEPIVVVNDIPDAPEVSDELPPVEVESPAPEAEVEELVLESPGVDLEIPTEAEPEEEASPKARLLSPVEAELPQPLAEVPEELLTEEVEEPRLEPAEAEPEIEAPLVEPEEAEEPSFESVEANPEVEVAGPDPEVEFLEPEPEVAEAKPEPPPGTPAVKRTELPTFTAEPQRSTQTAIAPAVSEQATKLYLDLVAKYGKTSRSGLRHLFSRWTDGPTPEERRQGMQRLSCSLPVQCVTTKSYHSGKVTNVSLGGLELELDFEPMKKMRLGVQLEGTASVVTGHVVWTSSLGGKYRAGLEFDQETNQISQTWVAQSLFALGAENFLGRPPRKFVRIELEVNTTLVLDDGTSLEVTLLDLSLGGCLLKTKRPFDMPEITLRLGSVDCRGMVVHTRADEANGFWHHHIRFKPLKRFERLRLRKTLLLLLKANR